MKNKRLNLPVPARLTAKRIPLVQKHHRIKGLNPCRLAPALDGFYLADGYRDTIGDNRSRCSTLTNGGGLLYQR